MGKRDGTATLGTERYVPLVHHLAASVQGRVPRHVAFDDLVSAGLLALTEAARSFDVDRGVPFERYAATRIRGALLDELRTMDWAARSVRARARTVDVCRQELATRLRRPPTEGEVAASMGVSVDELRRVAADVDRAVVVHYDAGEGDESGDQLLPASPVRPEDVVVDGEGRRELRAAVDLLPVRHRAVITGWFFEGRLMDDIAEELGVTASRVSQLRSEALVLLRDALGAGPAVVAPLDGRGARRRAAFRRTLQAA